MIKFTATDNDGGTTIVGIGLSYTNLDRLRKGKPINIEGASIGIGHDIFIFAGKNEDTMAEQLKPVISARTIIKGGA